MLPDLTHWVITAALEKCGCCTTGLDNRQNSTVLSTFPALGNHSNGRKHKTSGDKSTHTGGGKKTTQFWRHNVEVPVFLMCGVFAHRCAILAPGQKLQTPEQFVPERLIMMSGWDWRMFGIQRSADELTPCDACPPIPAARTLRRHAQIGVSASLPLETVAMFEPSPCWVTQTEEFGCKCQGRTGRLLRHAGSHFPVRTRSEPGKSQMESEIWLWGKAQGKLSIFPLAFLGRESYYVLPEHNLHPNSSLQHLS